MRTPSPSPEITSTWLVYVLECDDGSYYTGVTNDLAKRFKAHSTGRGAKYTRMHPPRKVLMTIPAGSKSESLQLEIWLKRKGRSGKVELIRNGAKALKKAWSKYKKQIEGNPAQFPWQKRPRKARKKEPQKARPHSP